MMTFQEVVEAIGNLSVEDRDRLFELIRQQKVEERRAEISVNAGRAFKALEEGTAKRGSFEKIKSYLLEDDEE